MKHCFTHNVPHQYGVKLEQREGKDKTFRVTYGHHVKDNLTYAQAATELGSCLMHALACNGDLDNEGKWP